MTAPQPPIGTLRDLTRHRNLALAILISLAFFVVGWGGFAQISGAVVAQGRISVESGTRRVQHREGGILAQVLVREGDRVRAGDVLARLDATSPAATAAAVGGEFEQLTARKIRLESERDQARDLPPPPAGASAAVLNMFATENSLLQARRSALDLRQSQLQQQVRQLQEDQRGLQAQHAAAAGQSRLIGQELEGIRALYAKGYATLARVNQLEREAVRLDGEARRLAAASASSRARSAEIELQARQLQSDHRAEVMAELKEVEAKISQIREARTKAQDELGRAEVRAPVSGVVQQVGLARGGVAAPGDTLMLVVPDAESLVVEVFIEPQHIDQVAKGRTAHVRFTAFASATTPELVGRVDRIAPDVRADERTGASYYLARLQIRRESLPSGLLDKLRPGMPAEIQIETVRRSAISYFLKPLTDQFQRTFRED